MSISSFFPVPEDGSPSSSSRAIISVVASTICMTSMRARHPCLLGSCTDARKCQAVAEHMQPAAAQVGQAGRRKQGGDDASSSQARGRPAAAASDWDLGKLGLEFICLVVGLGWRSGNCNLRALLIELIPYMLKTG